MSRRQPFLITFIPRKGSLPFSSSSIVKLKNNQKTKRIKMKNLRRKGKTWQRKKIQVLDLTCLKAAKKVRSNCEVAFFYVNIRLYKKKGQKHKMSIKDVLTSFIFIFLVYFIAEIKVAGCCIHYNYVVIKRQKSNKLKLVYWTLTFSNRELKQRRFSYLNDACQPELDFLHSWAVALPKSFG